MSRPAHKTEVVNRTKNVQFHFAVFSGKEKDAETGYGYFGARYMDHELMTMWLSVDPMADKYPCISPYAYCNWNPIKLVDLDGNEAIDNDDWYINSKGEVRWFNSTAETYTHEGEEYQRVGKTAYMTNCDGEFVYGDQYGNTHSSKPLREVSVTETLTDFERTMRNPLVQSIHQSAAD
ncbi:MAG: RHS repeat-associated core domain-containing protein, partial [Bacteroidales bacterium]|nr:RHS repeat-associated core domain-containing protein [Bacteroidales bacterium]